MGDWIRELAAAGEIPQPRAPGAAAHAVTSLGRPATDWAVQTALIVKQRLDDAADAEGFKLTGHEHAALEAAILALLEGITSGDPFTVPNEAVEQVRWAARQGLPVEKVLRIIWVSHSEVQSALVAAMTRQVVPGDLAPEVLRISNALLEFMEAIIGELTVVFEEESAAWGRHRSASIRRVIDHLVETGEPEPDTEQLIGVRLSDHHLAAVTWPADGQASPSWSPDLARWVDTVRRKLDSSGVVIVPRTDGSTEVIWSAPSSPSLATLEGLRRLTPPHGTAIAFGMGGKGVMGLRDSLVAARRVAVLGRSVPESRTWTYVDHGGMALMLADIDAASMYVRHTLAGLLSSDERSATLRATLRAFLVTGGSRIAAAHQMHVAPTTVAYRVSQASDMLVRPIEGREFDIVTALALANEFSRLLLS